MTHPLYRQSLVGGLTLVVASLLAAQAPPLPCDCAGVFDETVRRIEREYVAFPIIVPETRHPEWNAHVERWRPAAARADGIACSWIVRELFTFFPDGHLSLIDVPTADSGGRAMRFAARRVAATDAAPITDRDIAEPGGAPTHELGGIWRGPGYRVAVRVDVATPDRATAYALDDGPGAWRRGDVRAEFVRVAGRWRATLWDDEALPRTSPVELSRGALLRIAPVLWAREGAAAAEAFLDPVDPRRPTVTYPDDSTAVISVISFDPRYREALSTVIDREWRTLRARAVVLIDMRGNEGGSSPVAAPLMPFLFVPGRDPAPSDPAPAEALVRSSPRTIRYWETAGWAPRGLLDRMRAAPGANVALDPTAKEYELPRPSRRPRPDQHVFVATDRATVSAAEQVVLWARRMGKATIVGAPTGGSIDYQSTFFSRVACGPMGQTLGMPVIATSARLRDGGHNQTGILPDIARGGVRWQELVSRAP